MTYLNHLSKQKQCEEFDYHSANVLYSISTYLIFHEYQFSDNDDKRMNICISAHSCTFWYLLVRTAYKLVHNFRYVQLAQAARQAVGQLGSRAVGKAAAHGPFKGLFICNFPKIEQLVCVCEWRLLQCIALFTIIKSLLPSKSNSLSIFQSFEFIIFH